MAINSTKFIYYGDNAVLVYVIGWMAIVFGINSANRKETRSKIVQGKAEHYFLPVYNVKTRPQPSILLQINPTTIATVTRQQKFKL